MSDFFHHRVTGTTELHRGELNEGGDSSDRIEVATSGAMGQGCLEDTGPPYGRQAVRRRV